MCLSHELLTMPLYKFALPAVDHHGKERGHKCISWKSWPRCSVGVNEKHLVLGSGFIRRSWLSSSPERKRLKPLRMKLNFCASLWRESKAVQTPGEARLSVYNQP